MKNGWCNSFLGMGAKLKAARKEAELRRARKRHAEIMADPIYAEAVREQARRSYHRRKGVLTPAEVNV